MGALTEELVQRILAAAADLSDERIDRLLTQATAEAEAEVKDLLKSSIKAALLQRAMTRLGTRELSELPAASRELPGNRLSDSEPDGDAVGCYVYCILAADRRTPKSSLRGVNDEPDLIPVRHGPLQAITSPVRLSEFGREALPARISDPQWLEPRARAHDCVLKAAMADGPIVPLRFCTILRTSEDLMQVLQAHEQKIGQVLAELAGKKEWGIKMVPRKERQAAASEATSGRTYLEKKHQALRQGSVAPEVARRRAQECHEKLAAVAADSTLLPAQSRAQEAAVLNAAYLVADGNERKFHALIAGLDERLEADDLTLEVTGPWPPYNFVNLDLSLAPP